MSDNIYPLVSIVIPTRDNNPDTNLYLKMTLEGISMQDYPNIETQIICRQTFDKVSKTLKPMERSAQLNIGIKSSHGKYILRLDDDWFLPPMAITELVGLLETNQYDFACINNRFLKSKSLLKEVKRIERDIIISYKENNLHVAGNFFPKTLLVKEFAENIYDESIYANEDFDLHDRLISKGYKFAVAKSVILHLNESPSWKTLFNKSRYYGKNMKHHINKSGTIHINPFRISYLRHLNKFNTPKLFIGFILFKTIQYSGALVGYLE